MDALIQDWTDFCKGKRDDLSGSYFFTLFVPSLTHQQLETIFGHFEPYVDALVERMLCVKEIVTPDVSRERAWREGNNRNGKKELVDLAARDIAEQNRVLKRNGRYREVCSILDRLTPKYVDKASLGKVLLFDESGSRRYDGLDAAISYYMVERVISWEKPHMALFEAFYGLVADYRIVYYLGAPLIATDMDSSTYFEFWKRGGEYVLTRDHILVRYMGSAS